MHIALLPAKPPHLAKTRLSPLLAPRDRAALSRAMFDDVLAALTGSHLLDVVIVVTADAELAEGARSLGARAVAEGSPTGLNSAVRLGTTAALELGASSTLVVLSDIPLLRPADVDELIRCAPGHGAALVPSKEGTGTNAILRRPPHVFPTFFGARSLERHVAAAADRSLPCTVLHSRRVELDIDTPEDLLVLASEESLTATYRETVRLGLAPARPTA